MKNIAVNALSYTGEVTLSQYIGTKKVRIARGHNTGGASLFNFLANCLIGDFTYVKANYPTKIKVLNQEVFEDAYKYSSVSGFLFLRKPPTKVEEKPDECRVRYSFTIPRDLLENATSVSTLGLGLYSNSAEEAFPENFVAFCALTGDLAIKPNEIVNTSLVVDWDLVITNGSSRKSATAARAIS
jgi:hypothetical protein